MFDAFETSVASPSKKNATRATPWTSTEKLAFEKELLGFYVIDCADREAAIAAARDLRRANPSAMYEIRPVRLYLPGMPLPLTEAAVDA